MTTCQPVENEMISSLERVLGAAFVAEQVETAAVADRLQAGGNAVGIDAVGVLAFQPEEHGLVAAVALAGGAERTIQLDLDAVGGGQQAITPQPFGEACGSAHRADGMGTGGADANLEQVEDA